MATREKASANATATAERTKTQYVVLEAVRVREDALSKALENIDPEERLRGEVAAEATLPPGKHADAGYVTLWLPIRDDAGDLVIVEAANTDQAEKAGAKDDNATARHGKDVQRSGSFRAIPLRSWRGGQRFKSRMVQQTDSEALDDV